MNENVLYLSALDSFSKLFFFQSKTTNAIVDTNKIDTKRSKTALLMETTTTTKWLNQITATIQANKKSRLIRSKLVCWIANN